MKYGEFSSEKMANENEQCRQIVREIATFGVSQRQRYLLIYLLSLELENIHHTQTIASVVKELSDEAESMFLTSDLDATKERGV